MQTELDKILPTLYKVTSGDISKMFEFLLEIENRLDNDTPLAKDITSFLNRFRENNQ